MLMQILGGTPQYFSLELLTVALQSYLLNVSYHQICLFFDSALLCSCLSDSLSNDTHFACHVCTFESITAAQVKRGLYSTVTSQPSSSHSDQLRTLLVLFLTLTVVSSFFCHVRTDPFLLKHPLVIWSPNSFPLSSCDGCSHVDGCS